MIYADEIIEYNNEITSKIIEKKGKKNKIRYYFKSIWFNRKKLTIGRIIFNIKRNEKI